MRRKQTTFPDWWKDVDINDRLREKLTAQFTIHRDGYMRWYDGQPRFVCGKSVPAEAVEDAWNAKRNAIDAAKDQQPPGDFKSYRVVLSEFLDIQRSRVDATKNRISRRTYNNYTKVLNDFGAFMLSGRRVADLDIGDIGPAHFTAYAGKFSKWKASGFDSVVCLVCSVFNFAVEMGYVDRYKTGPVFVRPSKDEIRGQRLDRVRAFTPAEVVKLVDHASGTMRLMILIGFACGMNNSEVANLKRDVADLKEKLVDFRRRKTGKIRRVCPIPDDLVDDLRKYSRPSPASPEYASHFFLTVKGTPYDSCGSTISRLMRKVMESAGLTLGKGRNFGGLRTTFYNLCPVDGYDIERKIIMGHAHGAIDLDHYLETVHLDRLRHVSNFVWSQLSTSRRDSAS